MKPGKRPNTDFRLLIMILVIVSAACLINVVFAADTAPPGRSNPSPANNSNVASPVLLGLDTNETAGCRYSTLPGQNYSDMTVFTSTNATSHNSSITLAEYASYNYFVKCSDAANNVNTNDFHIQFSYLPNYSYHGSSVTLNLAFHIGTEKFDDVIYASDSYVAATGNDVVVALASSGYNFQGNFSKNHSATDYIIQLKESKEDNMFILGFTKGDEETIKDDLYLLGDRKIPPKAFATFTDSAGAYPVFVRLDYDDADITSRLGWSGGGQVLIKNQGNTNRGIPNITIEVVD